MMARSIDVEQLLIWAYRDECVGFGASGRVGPSMALTASIYSMGALGTRVSGGGQARASVPEDALAVEAAVERLPDEERLMVVQHASAGTRPDWSFEAATGPILTNEVGEPLPSRRQAARRAVLMADRHRNAFGCYVRFAGTTIDDARDRWLNWMVWHGALRSLDAALRPPKTRLKRWELAEFSLARMPWLDDPAVPRAFVSQVFFTKRKNIDTLTEA